MNIPSRSSFTLARRQLLTGLLSLALPGLSPDLARAAGLADTRLRVAALKGDDASFFADAGLAGTPYKIEQIRISQASQASEALNAGAYDFALQSNIASVFLPSGTPIRLAGFVGFAPTAFKVYVRRGSGITAPHQIKGKRIGYMRGGPLHLLLLEILKQEKLGLADIRPVALSAQDSASAFLSGNLDVVLAGMFAPSYQIEQGGGEILVHGGHYPAFDANNGSSFAVHASALADPLKRQAIADYVRRLQRAWQWLDEHEDQWAASLAKLYGVPPAFVLRHRPRPKPTPILSSSEGRARLAAVTRTFAEAGAIPAVPDLGRLWDSGLDGLLPRN